MTHEHTPSTTAHYVPPSTPGFTAGYRLGGNFRLEKQLGRGGMGEAWKAYDETAERHVVLKFVPREIQHITAAIESVRDSFKKVHKLQHQHICPIYALQNDLEHGLYVVMKYIDGVPLDVYRRNYVAKNGSMPFAHTIQILWAIAKGLDYAHENKILHRDIKPQNVMIGQSDGVQIIDFGLAEEIRTSMLQYTEAGTSQVSGTRSYMAPEQWQGRSLDARTDQYALAVTAYQLFSGDIPFSATDAIVLRECVLSEPPLPIPTLPDYVNAALLKALSKKREDRYENCKAFVKAMATKPNAEKSVANFSTGESSAPKRSVTKKAVFVGIAVAVILSTLVFLLQVGSVPPGGDVRHSAQGAGVPAQLTSEGGDVHTALLNAINRGDTKTVELLVSKGANVNGKWGAPPLYLASCHGHFEIVRLLVSKGADVNRKEGHGGGNPLCAAAFHRRLEIVKYGSSEKCVPCSMDGEYF